MSDDYETHELELAFQAGAASRDAEVAELKSVPMKYRRMAFNAQLQDEVAKLEKENNQLRTQINTLTEALEFCSGTSYIDDAHKMANETLALIGSTT